MRFSRSKKTHHKGSNYSDSENFRKRALIFGLLMAISAILFLGAALYFTGMLEIVL